MSLPTASDIMVRRVHTIRHDADIDDAIRLLLEHDHSGAPVVDAEGRVQGVLSEHDCIRVLAHALSDRRPEGRVCDHMTAKPETVPPHEDLLSLAGRFAEGRHRRLLVVEEGRLVGIVSRRDLLGALEAFEQQVTRGRRSTTYDAIDERHRKLD